MIGVSAVEEEQQTPADDTFEIFFDIEEKRNSVFVELGRRCLELLVSGL